MYILIINWKKFTAVIFLITLITIGSVLHTEAFTTTHPQNLENKTIFLSNSGAQGLSWSPNGTYIAVASYTGITVYQRNGGLVWFNITHSSPYDIAWSPDGSKIALGCFDGVFMYSSNGTLLWYHPANKVVESIDWSPDGSYLVAAEYKDDGKAYVFYANNGTVLWSKDNSGTVFKVDWSPNGELIAIGGSSGVLVVDALTGNIVFNRNNIGLAPDLAWSPDNSYLAIAYIVNNVEGGALLFDTGGNVIWDYHIDAHGRVVVWDPNGDHIIFGADDGARILSKYGNVLWYNSTIEDVFGASWSPDNNLIAITDIENIYVFYTSNLTMKWMYEGYGWIYDVKWNPNSTHVAIAASSNGYLLFDNNGTIQYMSPDLRYTATSTVSPLQFNPVHNMYGIFAAGAQASFLTVFSTDNNMYLWNVNYGIPKYICCFTWSSTGDYIAVGINKFYNSSYGVIDIYSSTGEFILSINITSQVYSLEWSKDDSMLAIGTPNNVLVYNFSANSIQQIISFMYPVTLDWSLNNTYILTGGYSGLILINTRNNTVNQLGGSNSYFMRAFFVQNDSYILAQWHDLQNNTFRFTVYDISGNTIWQTPPDAKIYSFTLSPDEKTAALENDNSISLIKIVNGETLWSKPINNIYGMMWNPVKNSIALFSSDSVSVISSYDGTELWQGHISIGTLLYGNWNPEGSNILLLGEYQGYFYRVLFLDELYTNYSVVRINGALNHTIDLLINTQDYDPILHLDNGSTLYIYTEPSAIMNISIVKIDDVVIGNSAPIVFRSPESEFDINNLELDPVIDSILASIGGYIVISNTSQDDNSLALLLGLILSLAAASILLLKLDNKTR